MGEYNNGTTYFMSDDSALIVGDGVQLTWWLSKNGIIPRKIISTSGQNEGKEYHSPTGYFGYKLLKNGYLLIKPELPAGYKVLVTFVGEKQ